MDRVRLRQIEQQSSPIEQLMERRGSSDHAKIVFELIFSSRIGLCHACKLWSEMNGVKVEKSLERIELRHAKNGGTRGEGTAWNLSTSGDSLISAHVRCGSAHPEYG